MCLCLTRLLVALQTIILVGVILLTANTASTYHNWVIFYAFAQFIFGFGIGGEYPVRTLHLCADFVHADMLADVSTMHCASCFESTRDSICKTAAITQQRSHSDKSHQFCTF